MLGWSNSKNESQAIEVKKMLNPHVSEKQVPNVNSRVSKMYIDTYIICAGDNVIQEDEILER